MASLWYKKNKKSIFNKNVKKCFCLFNDNKELVRICDEHKDYVSNNIIKNVDLSKVENL